MTRRFEFKDAKSNKFWEITINGQTVSVQYGRIGTDGQTQVKNHATPAEAEAAAEKQVAEKVKKGYQEVGTDSANSAPAAPAVQPVQSKPQPAAAPSGKSSSAKKTVDKTQMSAIRELLGHSDITTVRQGLAMLRALDDEKAWQLLAKGTSIDTAGRIVLSQPLKEMIKEGHRQEVALWLLRGSRVLDSAMTLTIEVGEHMADLEVLCGLPALTQLSLEGSGTLKDLTALRDMPALVELRLIECDTIERLDGLESIPSLRTLRLWWCSAIASLASLPRSIALEVLDVSWCRSLTDVAGVAGRATLQHLDLSGCSGLTGLETLRDLPSLRSLNLSYCTSLSSTTGITGLPAIETLLLNGCESLSNIDDLSACPTLRSVELEGVQLEGANVWNASAATTNEAPSVTVHGKTFLFTGTLSGMTRDDAEQLVQMRGGTVLSSVSAKLDYLVIGDKAGSKLTKARAIPSITILSEEEFQSMVSGPAIVPAGNKAVVSALTKMRSNHSVLLRAHLQNGCSEKGRGSGEYEGCAFEMRYTIGWNEGYLETGEYDGYPIDDVIAVLSQYPLAKIGHDQFGLRPGQLQSGYGEEYQIDWEDDEPEDAPDGFTLHKQMDIDDCEYEWGAAASLEIEVSDIGASFTIDH